MLDRNYGCADLGRHRCFKDCHLRHLSGCVEEIYENKRDQKRPDNKLEQQASVSAGMRPLRSPKRN